MIISRGAEIQNEKEKHSVKANQTSASKLSGSEQEDCGRAQMLQGNGRGISCLPQQSTAVELRSSYCALTVSHAATSSMLNEGTMSEISIIRPAESC